MSVQNSARLLAGRLFKFALLVVVLYGAAWCYFNWEYVRERFGAKYEEERYGIVWNTNLNAARRIAARHGRLVMVVYINSGAKHDPSDYLINRIFPSTQFRSAADTYIPVLVDIRQGVQESARLKNNQDEIIKVYDLHNRYGLILLADADGRELRRVQYSDEPVDILLGKVAGGKFTPLPPIPKPGVKDPVAESEKKAKSLTSPVVGPKSERPKVEEKWGISTGL